MNITHSLLNLGYNPFQIYYRRQSRKTIYSRPRLSLKLQLSGQTSNSVLQVGLWVQNVSRSWPMQAVARLEICTMRINVVLHYCTLLLTSSSNPVTRPTVMCSLGHFGTHCYFSIICFVNHCFFPCGLCYCHIISPTFSQLRHGFLNFRTALSFTHYFAQAITLKASFVVECSVLPPRVTLL